MSDAVLEGYTAVLWCPPDSLRRRVQVPEGRGHRHGEQDFDPRVTKCLIMTLTRFEWRRLSAACVILRTDKCVAKK